MACCRVGLVLMLAGLGMASAQAGLNGVMVRTDGTMANISVRCFVMLVGRLPRR